MERWVCLHGHFYQPPRENPWLEAIELQDSARPYHDWNERVTAECYAPNASARILDGAGRIARIVNNYARISFNFGPTLLSWLAAHDAPTYGAILAADRASRERFGGHGSALAQAYGHAILPLCNERDRETQVRWGVRDFEWRFGRKPEGMWLPETAVDLATLETLARAGLRFTLLSPTQAARTRPLGATEWQDVAGGRVDPRRPYRVALPSGAEIVVFFYDGAIAHAIAFGGLLASGEELVRRLLASPAGLVHVATDGETYGHHHRFGEMALAWALDDLETQRRARLTNYGEFLERHPPTHEVEIRERTAWSCAHGLGRWSRDCGCAVDPASGFTQAWRAPLREALDGLRDALAPRWETTAARWLTDPWAARDAYVDRLLDPSPSATDAFLARWGRGALAPAERTTVLELLELQRHALLMYTSCGWFFDELSGLEPTQVLQYATRTIELAEKLWNEPFEPAFVERLARAPSNIAEYGDGRGVWERRVRPARAGLAQIGANATAGLLFGE
ncbi:MAG TPA: DUF3536 domain-containing protein, partial [Candidatus Polarisedimenticolaceae bacterium]|nr:DUF3536 domain-containing protein [Candidatus Polarisedimenticolaceae bacterium]